jgi:hypothetical protein
MPTPTPATSKLFPDPPPLQYHWGWDYYEDDGSLAGKFHPGYLTMICYWIFIGLPGLLFVAGVLIYTLIFWGSLFWRLGS